MIRGREPADRGVTLLELLLSLLLFSVVVQGAWKVLASHRTAAADVAERAEALETVRTIAWILGEELPGVKAGEDWWWLGTDSLQLRAFRGVGIVAEIAPEESWASVCYRGIRRPNPEKDSVLVLERDGRWQVHGLQGRKRGEQPCPSLGGGWTEDWILNPFPVDPVLGRVFERGSYHLVNGALRYRRGEGGRQPLTPPRIESGGFFLGGPGAAALSWKVTLSRRSPFPDPPTWEGVIR